MSKLRQITTGGKSFILTIPKPLIKIKEWKKGDEIQIILDHKTGNIILKKL